VYAFESPIMHLATDNGKFDNSAAVSWKDDTNVLPTMRATGKSEDLREKLQQSVAVWEGSIRSTKSYEKRAWLGGLQRLQKSQSLTEPMRSTGCRLPTKLAHCSDEVSGESWRHNYQPGGRDCPCQGEGVQHENRACPVLGW